MPRREREYQPGLIKRIERLFHEDLLEDDEEVYVRKIDIQQGWPDLLILAPRFWALLEVKRDEPTCADDFEPNQEWWIEEFDQMSFSACIYPENEQEVLHALQQAYESRR
jgi:hypothetical protein